MVSGQKIGFVNSFIYMVSFQEIIKIANFTKVVEQRRRGPPPYEPTFEQLQCCDASHDSFKRDTEISYIETP